jgi:hypothetical protein
MHKHNAKGDKPFAKYAGDKKQAQKGRKNG